MTTPELQIKVAKAGAPERDLDANPLAPLVMPAECTSIPLCFPFHAAGCCWLLLLLRITTQLPKVLGLLSVPAQFWAASSCNAFACLLLSFCLLLFKHIPSLLPLTIRMEKKNLIWNNTTFGPSSRHFDESAGRVHNAATGNGDAVGSIYQPKEWI